MRKLALFLFTALAVVSLFTACSKESDNNQTKKSSLLFTSVRPNLDNVNTTPFTIYTAGIYNNYLFLGLTYTGGDVPHEFYVAWDGTVQEIDSKKFIDLKIYHKNTTDNGTQIINDSLVLDISNLNISQELLTDKNLYFNVINTSNLENVLVIPAVVDNGGGTTPIPTEFQKIVEVVEQGCEKGIWGDLWLKANDDTCYLPKSIENSISYTPTLNDKLKITFERTWLSDSTEICPSWQGKQVEIINIKELEKLNK